MSNLGLEHALAKLSLPFARAKVGDRYVLEMLHQRGWQLGGENSGHIICLDKHSTGDGIISALQVLGALGEERSRWRAAAGVVFPQVSSTSKYPGAGGDCVMRACRRRWPKRNARPGASGACAASIRNGTGDTRDGRGQDPVFREQLCSSHRVIGARGGSRVKSWVGSGVVVEVEVGAICVYKSCYLHVDPRRFTLTLGWSTL
jgi:hypothetical protein